MQQLVILLVIVPQRVSGVSTPIIRRSDRVSLPMVFCPVVAVVVLESRMASCVHSTQCTRLAIRLSNTTTGQKTTGSETRSDLLMMGVKTPETC